MDAVRARLCSMYTDQQPRHDEAKVVQFGDFVAIDATDESRLENYKPDSPDDFSYLLTIDICALDGGGVATFDAQVCTPKWLARRSKKNQSSTVCMSSSFRSMTLSHCGRSSRTTSTRYRVVRGPISSTRWNIWRIRLIAIRTIRGTTPCEHDH